MDRHILEYDITYHGKQRTLEVLLYTRQLQHSKLNLKRKCRFLGLTLLLLHQG